MRLGIIGLPQSGKTTLFNALTRGSAPTGISAGKIEMHTAVVDVPDARVDKLSAMFNPKKTIYAKVTYVDIAGLDGSSGKGEISGALLNQLLVSSGLRSIIPAYLAFGAVGFSIIVAIAAGMYPALRAMKLSPLAAIRNE